MTKMAHPSCWSEVSLPFATKESTVVMRVDKRIVDVLF